MTEAIYLFQYRQQHITHFNTDGQESHSIYAFDIAHLPVEKDAHCGNKVD